MAWVEDAKRRAAGTAASHVESGSVIGLGTGSTALYFIRAVGSLLRSGEISDILAVPTSRRTEAEAKGTGIPLTSLDEHPEIDLAVDGADQLNEALDAIKGGGGALLREKVIASASKTYIIIIDEGKLTPRLGEGFPLPIEVLPFSLGSVKLKAKKMGANVSLRAVRGGAEPYVTDNGNYVMDADFGYIAEPRVLEAELKGIPGVLETGLFLGYTDLAYVGTPEGVRAMRRLSEGATNPRELTDQSPSNT
jgi:ribose 5-phosphate isomerase A